MMSSEYSRSEILLVDVDSKGTERVRNALIQEGFEIHSAYDGQTALYIAGSRRIDLILLEMTLPDIPGTEVCKMLRENPKTSKIPIVFITNRDSEADKVAGFTLGATDYVVKPFSFRELTMRVRAILRRQVASVDRDELVLGPIKIDIPRFQVTVNETSVILTRQEFRLLIALVRGNGRVFSRNELIESVWGQDSDVLERTVDAHVKGLRAKLGTAGRLVETVYGVGYRVKKTGNHYPDVNVPMSIEKSV